MAAPGREWITVAFVKTISYNADTCGMGGPTLIEIVQNSRCDRWFSMVFAHEFGHTMGFDHVAGRHLMAADGGGQTSFTAKEQYHAQLAYQVGPDAEFCGWP